MNRCIRLTGWRPGLSTISLVDLIRQATGCGLAEGKRKMEELLDGQVVDLPVASSEIEEIRLRLDSLGVHYQVIPH